MSDDPVATLGPWTSKSRRVGVATFRCTPRRQRYGRLCRVVIGIHSQSTLPVASYAAPMSATGGLMVIAVISGTIFPLNLDCGTASASETQVSHWGAFFEGDGFKDTLSTPTPINLPGPVIQVASSNSTQYALLANGTVYAWGLGAHGQLGNGGSAASLTVAVKVRFPKGVRIADLPTDVMPYATGLAEDTKGHAWGWGFDQSGQLCLGNNDQHLTPVELPFRHVTAMAGAGDHALYDSSGTVYACGANAHGDLGDGSTEPSMMPVKVNGLAGSPVRALVAAYNDSGALLGNGTYLDWGFNGEGQLGDGHIGLDSSVPVRVALPQRVTQVTEGGSYYDHGQTLVMLSGGSLRSWGNDSCGQLGDGATATQPSPIAFSPPTGVTYERLATGGGTSYAVSTTGNVYSWGCGAHGQIGNGSTGNELTPVLVESAASSISATADDIVTS
jgi:alpha-tubulin suppressor-like RCC1 family protein